MALISAREFLKEFNLKGAQLANLKCETCEISLQESITGCRPLEDGTHLCSDCYFDEMGKEIDQRPLLTPRVRHTSR